MSISNHHPKLSEEEVLLAFAVEPSHNRETLIRYLKAYPDHSIALADLSIELMIDSSREKQEIPISNTNLDKAWRRFHSAIKNSAPPIDPKITNPFLGLSYVEFKKIADQMGMNKLLLSRVRDRTIILVTIPHRFIEKLASVLGTNVELLTSYLNTPPSITSSQSFKSDVKPTATEQISFVNAISTSNLTSVQLADLKALIED